MSRATARANTFLFRCPYAAIADSVEYYLTVTLDVLNSSVSEETLKRYLGVAGRLFEGKNLSLVSMLWLTSWGPRADGREGWCRFGNWHRMNGFLCLIVTRYDYSIRLRTSDGFEWPIGTVLEALRKRYDLPQPTEQASGQIQNRGSP
jgi:hypothetical protein